jgi:hypothetical protein
MGIAGAITMVLKRLILGSFGGPIGTAYTLASAAFAIGGNANRVTVPCTILIAGYRKAYSLGLHNQRMLELEGNNRKLLEPAVNEINIQRFKELSTMSVVSGNMHKSDLADTAKQAEDAGVPKEITLHTMKEVDHYFGR